MAKTGLLTCQHHGRAATRCPHRGAGPDAQHLDFAGLRRVGHLGLVASGAFAIQRASLAACAPSPPFPANRRPPNMRVIDPMGGLMH